jgi:hypothetical protein
MDKEQELKQQLKELKEKKRKKAIQSQLDRMTLVGKCYATHQLSRYLTTKPAYNFQVIHIVGKNYQDRGFRDYYYITDSIYVHKNGDTFQVTVGKGEEESPTLYKYEITLEQFNHVKYKLIPIIEKGIDELRDDFKAMDYVSGGDHTNESNKGDWLEKQGYEYIELKGEDKYIYGWDKKVLEMLRWYHHPYLFNTRLYKAPNWLEILINITDDLEKKAYQWGSSIAERDLPRAAALRKFIKEVK